MCILPNIIANGRGDQGTSIYAWSTLMKNELMAIGVAGSHGELKPSPYACSKDQSKILGHLSVKLYYAAFLIVPKFAKNM